MNSDTKTSDATDTQGSILEHVVYPDVEQHNPAFALSAEEIEAIAAATVPKVIEAMKALPPAPVVLSAEDRQRLVDEAVRFAIRSARQGGAAQAPATAAPAAQAPAGASVVSVSRNVHYHESPNVPLAAIVTCVISPEVVHLAVFNPAWHASGTKLRVPFSLTPKAGHWSWPPRV